jgi:prepilin-type N-terminal cleavage/methylation domain-containing protein
MMLHRRTTRRGGFTLLEVLLASALAVVLMAALYVALDVQLRLAAAGRDSIEQATLTRAIINRMEGDLANGIGPVTPPIDNSAKNTARQSGGTGMGGSGAGTSGAGASGSGTSGAATSGAMSGGTTEAGLGTDPAVVEMGESDANPFQAGVIGEADRLTIYVARVAGIGRDVDESGERPNAADIRRVSYWLTDKGLARQEMPWITSQQIPATAEHAFEDGKEEADYVIAEEVTRLQFEYWDGSTWAESWDGRELNADGKTLKGPPMAIRVRFWLRLPGEDPGQTIEKEFRHTIAVRAAAGPAVPDTATTTQQP